MKIRSATVADARLLAELNCHVHGLHVEKRPDIYKTPLIEEVASGFTERLKREDTRAFIAELDDGKAVGYALATITHRAEGTMFHEDTFVVLDQIAIDPEATRRGAGTSLLDAVRAAGREAGCRRFITDVWDFNTEALAFYEAAGFAPMKRFLEQPL